MKKLIAVVLALFMVAPLILAQYGGETASGHGLGGEKVEFEEDTDITIEEKPGPYITPVIRPIHSIYMNGSGIVVNAEDPLDFMNAKAIFGGFRLLNREQCITSTETDSTDSEELEKCFTYKRAGILLLDDEKYRLRNIEVSYEMISADIYSPLSVSTSAEDSEENHVGSIAVKRYEKPGRDIWAGEMKLNSKEYNAYFLGVKREFTSLELRQRLNDYCRENPREGECRYINICKNDPENENCGPVRERFCISNAGDIRCKPILQDICEEAPASSFCQKITQWAKPFYTIKPIAVSIEEKPIPAESIGVNAEIAQRTISIVRERLNNAYGNGKGGS